MSGRKARAAVIVAGGQSRRFGVNEKATATIGGTPLLRRVVERVGPHVDEVVINCRRNQCKAFKEVLDESSVSSDVQYAYDRVPGSGPVSGMAVGLHEANAQYTIVLACDLPFLDCGVVTDLFKVATTERRTAVPIVTGRLQPLCAVYRRDTALDACGSALATGDARARGVVERLDAVRVPVERPRPFRDVDTHAALERAREAAD